jgi:hypothetical protein
MTEQHVPARTRPALLRQVSLLSLLMLFLLAGEADAQSRRVRPLQVGREAPEFSLTTLDGSTVSLADFRGNKPVVVVFYRGWVGYW